MRGLQQRVHAPNLSLAPQHDLNIADLQLLHHFLTVTCCTLTSESKEEDIWRIPILRDALQHPFLLREIFSMTALHLSWLSDDPVVANEYIVKAAIHQDNALTEFRSVLSNINAENCQAVFTFSGVIALHSFAVPRAPDGCHDLEGILNCIQLVRGIDLSLTTWWDTIQLSETSKLIEAIHVNRNTEHTLKTLSESAPGSPDTDTHFLDELLAICAAVQDPGAASAYEHAVQQLRSTYIAVENPQGSSTIPMTCLWLSSISEVYVMLLRERKPEALLVMAYYAPLLHRHNHFWYFEGWGEHLIGVIEKQLGSGWKQQLSWPRKVIGAEDPDMVMVG